MAIQGRDGENQTLGRKADEREIDSAEAASVIALMKGLLYYAEHEVNAPPLSEILLELRRIRVGIGLIADVDLEKVVSG